MKAAISASALLLLALLAGCASPPPAKPGPLDAADAAVQHFVDAQQMPGAVLWIEHAGIHHERAFGLRVLATDTEAAEPMSVDTMFDAASLTKAIVTATLVQKLREAGKLDMDAPVSRYLPECAVPDKAAITLRQLLTHSSGLPPDLPATDPFFDGPTTTSVSLSQAQRNAQIEAAVQRACAQPMATTPGTHFRYSDLNFILMGAIVARVSGEPLQQFAQEQLFEPLGMKHSSYLPLNAGIALADIAPTARVQGVLLRGVVHDPTARRMGGVAGHAGLFTTADDLAHFARMLLNDGVSDKGQRFLSHESIVLLETPQSGLADQRSLGWDINTAFSRPRGEIYPKGKSFGHTGFTGCAFWLDPGSKSFFILLSHRVHEPHGTNILPLYGQLGTLSAEAAGLTAQP